MSWLVFQSSVFISAFSSGFTSGCSDSGIGATELPEPSISSVACFSFMNGLVAFESSHRSYHLLFVSVFQNIQNLDVTTGLDF